jgi:hypothetical protein
MDPSIFPRSVMNPVSTIYPISTGILNPSKNAHQNNTENIMRLNGIPFELAA